MKHVHLAKIYLMYAKHYNINTGKVAIKDETHVSDQLIYY